MRYPTGFRILVLCLSLVVLGLFVSPITGCRNDSGAAPSVQRIAIVYTAPHEAINHIIDGFREGLAERLPRGTYEISERHASGDQTQYSAAVEGALAQRPDLLVTITTPISQVALRNKPSDVPMIFLAVTDPVGAGLVESLDSPGSCSGVSDLAPFEAILRFIRQIEPSAARIGMPYSPEEQPAVFGRDQVVRLAPDLGFTVDARPVTSQDELPSVINALAADNDVLLIGSDNGMFEAAPLIVRTALGVNKPVFAGDSTSIQAGAVGGYTIDYTQVGREGAQLGTQVLQGESPGSLPVVVMREGVLELNRETAARLGITFSQETIAAAHSVYPDQAPVSASPER